MTRARPGLNNLYPKSPGCRHNSRQYPSPQFGQVCERSPAFEEEE